MEFILTAKNPVKHVTSIDDWDEMRALHGGFSLVGYFPDIYQNLDSLRNYRTFLSASYHMLEVDPFRTYLGGVAAVTLPSLAVRLHLNSSTGPPVRFAIWNGTSFAHPNKTVGISRTSIDNLYNWVKSKALQLDPLTGWAGTSGRKSFLLSNWLMPNVHWNTGYSLLAFFKRSTRRESSEIYNVFQEAALRYKTCDYSQKKDHVTRQSTYSLLETFGKIRRAGFLKKSPYGSTKMVDCLSDPWFARNFAYGSSNCDDYSSCPNYSNVTLTHNQHSTQWLSSTKDIETDYFKLSQGRFRRPVPGRPQMDIHIRYNYIMNSRLDCVLLFTQGRVLLN